MDVDDEVIDLIQAPTKPKSKKDPTPVPLIPKTTQYKLAGNSIVVACPYHIFRTLFIDNAPVPTEGQWIPMFP